MMIYKIEARIIEWRDLNYSVIWGGSSTWMDWSLVPHFGTTDDNRIEYRHADSSSGIRQTMDPNLAVADLRGFIKWDGCMQCSTEEVLHWDDRKGIRHLAEALERIRDLMREVEGTEIEER